MLRFFLAGLATVGGVVLLFFMSFGDVQGTWQSLEHKFVLSAQPSSPVASDSAAAAHQAAVQLMPRQADSQAQPQFSQHSSLRQQSLQAQIDALQSRLHAADQAMDAMQTQTVQQRQKLAQLRQQHDADQSQVMQLKQQQIAVASAAAQAKAQQQVAAQELRAQQQAERAAKQQQAEQAERAAKQQQAEQAERAAKQQQAEQAARQAKARQRETARRAKARRQQMELAARRAQQQASRAAERNSAPAPATSQQTVAGTGDADSLSAVLARLHREVAANPQPHPASPPVRTEQYAAVQNPPPITPSRERLSRARAAILHGRLQEAQQLLEEAQLQLVFRPVAPGGETNPSGSQSATDVAQALSMLGAGRGDAALHYVDRAMREIGAPPQQASLVPAQEGPIAGSQRY